MSLLDKIREESSSPSVKVDGRSDALIESLQQQESQSVSSVSEEDFEAELIAELESFPVISNKKVGVRLEEEILEALQTLCRRERITIETLLEAFHETCSGDETLMSQVIGGAKTRVQRRTRAGNIRSILTKSRNIRKRVLK